VALWLDIGKIIVGDNNTIPLITSDNVLPVRSSNVFENIA